MGGLGTKDLSRYLATREPLGKTSAIMAMCASCTNNYADGRLDCEIEDCPLHPFMPYTAKNRAKRGLGPGER